MSDKPRNVNVASLIDDAPISKFQWKVVFLCFLIALLDGFDTQAIAFVAPVLSEKFEIAPADMGQVFAAGLAGLMVGAFVFSPLADRIGRKNVILISVALFGGFALLTVFADSQRSLIIYRFLTGLGLGGAMPNINTLTAEYAPARRRAFLMTAMFVGFPLGAIFGGVISAQIILAYGWQSVFILGGVTPLLLLPVLYFQLPESVRFLAACRGPMTARRKSQIASILKRIISDFTPARDDSYVLPDQSSAGVSVFRLFSDGRGFGTLLLWAIFFINLLILYALVNWLPTVLRDAGLPLERAIIATVILNLGGVLGGLSFAWGIDRAGPIKILVPAYLFAAIFVALIGLAKVGIVGTLAIIFIAGFCVIGAQLGMNAVASNYYPTSVRSTGLGWALAVGRLGSIVGPLIVGALLSLEWGRERLFTAGGAPALIAAAALVLFAIVGQRRNAKLN